jgi:hypothetical protein
MDNSSSPASKPLSENLRCAATVRYTGGGLPPHEHQCSNKATVILDGIPLCLIHEKSYKNNKIKVYDNKVKYILRDAAPDLLAGCRAFVAAMRANADVPIPEPLASALAEAMSVAVSAIRKVEERTDG